MKNIIFSICLIFSVSVFAYDNPPQRGKCFLVKDGNPTKPNDCILYSGGGAGGSFVHFKVGKENILIENTDNVSIGHTLETLMDGEDYMRDGKTLKVIPTSDKDIPKYFCTKQISGKLDACFNAD